MCGGAPSDGGTVKNFYVLLGLGRFFSFFGEGSYSLNGLLLYRPRTRGALYDDRLFFNGTFFSTFFLHDVSQVFCVSMDLRTVLMFS